MALNLIEIKDFPRTTSVTGSGDELIVVSKADGKTYGIKTSDFKAFLGTVQVTTPKPISPTDPEPTLDGVYIPTIDGTYANAGGLTRETTEGQADYGMAVEFIKNGAVWVKNSYPLPMQDTSDFLKVVDVIDSLEIGDSEKPLSSNQGVIIKPRILPVGFEFTEIDRPDMDERSLYFINEEMNLVERIAPVDSIFIEYDRPDLFGAILIDNSNRILNKELIDQGSIIDTEKVSKIVNESITKSDLTPWFTEFDHQETPLDAFPDNPEDTLTYDEEIAMWDNIMNSDTVGSDYAPYITKTVIGESSVGGYDIFRYDFIPPNPTKKVLISGGFHGQEKNVVVANRRWFGWFIKNWHKNPMTQWARFNIHFIVVPVFCPSSFNPNPYSPAMDLTKWGERKVHETLPIACSWSRSGNVVTININEASFPDTQGRFSAGSYFSYPGIEGKTWIGIIDSSNASILPHGGGFVIDSVVNGSTITILTPSSGSSSGTCSIVVPTDPNRNLPYNTTTWQTITPSIINTNGYPKVSHDNKGSRPFSLSESLAYKNILENDNLSLIVNMHSGAGSYVLYRPRTMNEIPDAAKKTFELIAPFHGGPDINNLSFSLTAETYAFAEFGVPAFCPEWSGQSAPNTAKDATDLIRFMFNLILISSRYY